MLQFVTLLSILQEENIFSFVFRAWNWAEKEEKRKRRNIIKEEGKESVFSVGLVCQKEVNLMLKVSDTSSQGAVGFELKRH